MTLTGHAVGDAIVPSAMRLVWAVRDGDIAEMTAAIAAARDAANHPYWTTALVLVLAGMVADGVKASELLAWNS